MMRKASSASRSQRTKNTVQASGSVSPAMNWKKRITAASMWPTGSAPAWRSASISGSIRERM